jgi:predicted permease
MDPRKPSDPDADAIDAELKFHFSETVEALVEQGWPETVARAEAERRFGNRERYRRRLEKIGRQGRQRRSRMKDMMSLLMELLRRDATLTSAGGQRSSTDGHDGESRWRRLSFWIKDDVARDLRYALRMLRRSPVFTIVAILTLTLGSGANIAIFTIVSRVILRPLGYVAPEQLVSLTGQFMNQEGGLAAPEYAELRSIYRSLSGIGAFTLSEANLAAVDRPRRVRTAQVDDHLLAVLGLRVAQGRVFTASEINSTGPQPPTIAILSHELWQSAFGARTIVGQTVNIDGRPHEIIGVMPPGADIMDSRTELWLPLFIDAGRRSNRESHFLSLVGRLKDGVPLQAAQAELRSLLDNWSEHTGVTPPVGSHVPANSGPGRHNVRVQPLQTAILGTASRAIWVLQAAVGLVLLIVCANLGGLIVARSESRRREFTLRTAVGASSGRLLRQTLTEGLVLAAAGAVLGVWLARLGIQTLIRVYPTTLPRTSEVEIDGTVMLFAAGVAVVAAMFFGLVPVLFRPAGSLATALSEGGDRRVAGSARHRIRLALVVGEVALAVMLVIGAGLLIRTVSNLAAVDAGFNRSRLVTYSMTLPVAAASFQERARAYQQVLEALRREPGVQAATAMTGLPPDRRPTGLGICLDNYVNPVTGQPVEIIDYYQLVMTDFFTTMGIPIVKGRGFEPTDATSKVPVAVVNETMAKKIWGDRDPIGQQFRPCAPGQPSQTVIGVAKDVKQRGVDQATGTEFYAFVNQRGVAPPETNVVLRTNVAAEALLAPIERVVRGINPTVPIVRLRTMDQVFSESIRRPTLLAQLLTGFAALALVLAALGTYGLLAHTVSERRRDIGIRMALGAQRSKVLGEVMKQGLLPTIVGIVIGLAGSLALNRLIASLLFGVKPTDLVTLAAVTVTMMLIAAAACWFPSRRASLLDPIVVLRTD